MYQIKYGVFKTVGCSQRIKIDNNLLINSITTSTSLLITEGKPTAGGWSAWGDLLENFSGKAHAEWNFAPYMDILPGVSSQRK